MAGKLLSTCALFAGLITQPAAAQSGTWGATRKADAILGGQSRLAALVAQQSGEVVSLTRAAAPQPAGRGQLRLEQPAPYSTPPAKDRPDVFGTVALRVERTPLDGRWKQVQHGKVRGAIAAWAGSLADTPLDQRIEAVNSFVNARVKFVDDSRQYRTADVWQSVGQTLARRRGDCEDYAIAKLHLLRQAGVRPRDLYLVIVKDLVRRADHAVLVVRSGDRLLLLDNATDRVTDATAFQDYRPMLSYAATGRAAWTHGYARMPAAVTDALPSEPPAGVAEHAGGALVSALR